MTKWIHIHIYGISSHNHHAREIFQIYCPCFTLHSVSVGLPCTLAYKLDEAFILSKVQALIMDEIRRAK